MNQEGRYSRVSRRIWSDARFTRLSAAEPNGQTLFMRLLTAPELGIIPGLIPIGEAALSEALGWPPEGFRKAFQEVFLEGLAKADWKARLVWVPKALKHNPPSSPNVIKGWASAWVEMPECALKTEAFYAISAFVKGLPKAFQEAFAKAFAKVFRNQDQDQDQDQDHKNPLPPSGQEPGQESQPVQGRDPRLGDCGLLGAECEHFAVGIRRATGKPCSTPKAFFGRDIARICHAHAGGRRGAELAAWIESAASTFAITVDPKYGGFTVKRWGEWEDGGRVGLQTAEEKPAPWVPPPPPTPEEREQVRAMMAAWDIKAALGSAPPSNEEGARARLGAEDGPEGLGGVAGPVNAKLAGAANA